MYFSLLLSSKFHHSPQFLRRGTFLLATKLFLFFVFIESAVGQSISFDVPALLPTRTIDVQPSVTESRQKVVECLIPVTAKFADRSRVSIDEISFEVTWNRNVFPIVDFSPRTTMQSNIEGSISIEKRTERNAGVGLNLSSGYLDFVSPSANANLSNRKTQTRRYQEIPEQSVLVSSGTVRRGTGASFQFKSSRTQTLEGSRDLVVAFEVPSTWRAGLLMVTCRAKGEKKTRLWSDPFDEGVVFVLPIYQQGDDQARQMSEEFVRTEQQLRRITKRIDQNNSEGSFFSQWKHPWERKSDSDRASNQWVHRLIQSGNDQAFYRVEGQIDRQAEATASRFIAAREQLLRLSK